MNILFIGDIVGRIGRLTVAKVLPRLIKKHNIDMVIANAENSAHGSSVTESIIKELKQAGVDYFTAGDHAFNNRKNLDVYEKLPILRPANWSAEAPGAGFAVIEKNKQKILLISLIGRVFMKKDHDCPFYKINEILANESLHPKNLSAIIVDIHAEATSEKTAMKHFLDGRVSALLGTHTHIPTADAEITPEGMAYITDVGMVGAKNHCLGVEKDGIIRTFQTQIKEPHVIPEKGKAIFNSILIKIAKNQKATSIKPITEIIAIK